MTPSNGRVRITVSPALVAVSLTVLMQLGAGIWAFSALSAKQDEHSRTIDSNYARVSAIEAEMSRSRVIAQEFREAQKRIERIEASEASVLSLGVAIARLEEQVRAIRDTQLDLVRRFEGRTTNHVRPAQPSPPSP